MSMHETTLPIASVGDNTTNLPGASLPAVAPPALAGDAPTSALLRHRIARLNSDIPSETTPAEAALVQKRLEDLAFDQVLTAAKALSTALRDVAYLPPSLSQPLVRSFRLAIASPVRDACMALGDGEMRRAIMGPVRTAADLRDLVLDAHGQLLAGSSERRLSDRLRLIEDRALHQLLPGHPDLDPPTTREVMATTLRRIRWIEERDPNEISADWAARFHERGRLDEVILSDAISWEADEDIMAALSLRAAIPLAIVRIIIGAADARALTALVWKAGLPMRLALLLQITATAGITPAERLNARDGTDFPLGENEMNRHLVLYGVSSP